MRRCCAITSCWLLFVVAMVQGFMPPPPRSTTTTTTTNSNRTCSGRLQQAAGDDKDLFAGVKNFFAELDAFIDDASARYVLLRVEVANVCAGTDGWVLFVVGPQCRRIFDARPLQKLSHFLLGKGSNTAALTIDFLSLSLALSLAHARRLGNGAVGVLERDLQLQLLQNYIVETFRKPVYSPFLTYIFSCSKQLASRCTQNTTQRNERTNMWCKIRIMYLRRPFTASARATFTANKIA